MEENFCGPAGKPFNFLIFLIGVFGAVIIFMWPPADIYLFLMASFIIGIILFGTWCLYYFVMKKAGGWRSDAYIFKISNSGVESIKNFYVNYHIKVSVNNIRKIKYERDIGGTGTRILIWPKYYEKLKECGFKFDDKVLEYYKKHRLPVILFPPAMSRAERKRLKGATYVFNN